ncbi:reverse transcriptase domain-containing protein [Rhodocaloribacter sp.]
MNIIHKQQKISSLFLDALTLSDLASALTTAYRNAYPERDDPKITTRSLSYLAFHCNKRYRSFEIPKKSGGMRTIRAPLPKLKIIQRALNICFQCVFRPHKAAYGFVPGRSIVDNARVHAGRRYIYNVDLKDFFPNTSFRRVKTVLELEPFSFTGDREPLAFLIANLCCENDDKGKGALPQGAPTSPTLTNVVCQRLDRKLYRLARQNRAHYSRYADDLTFSSNDDIFTKDLQSQIKAIIREEGYEVNQKKVRLQSRHIRQEVTGLTVNVKPNVRRAYIKDVRYWLRTWRVFGYEKATADFIDRHGATTALSGKTVRLEHVLAGKIAFLGMVRGQHDGIVQRFRTELDNLLSVHPKQLNENLLDSVEDVSEPVGQLPEKSNEVLSELRRILEIWENEGIDAVINHVYSRDSSLDEQD